MLPLNDCHRPSFFVPLFTIKTLCKCSLEKSSHSFGFTVLVRHRIFLFPFWLQCGFLCCSKHYRLLADINGTNCFCDDISKPTTQLLWLQEASVLNVLNPHIAYPCVVCRCQKKTSGSREHS